MNNQISQLQAKIAQLEKENSQLRAGFYEIIDLAYQAVNKSNKEEPTFSFFAQQQTEHLKECFFSFLKDLTPPAKECKEEQDA